MPSPLLLSNDAIASSLSSASDSLPSLSAWREARKAAISQLRSALSSPSPPSHIILDDTQHLRSMRKSVYNAIKDCASPRSVSLFFLTLAAPLPELLARNAARPPSSRVSDASIRKIVEMLQLPGSPSSSDAGVPVPERGNVLLLPSSSSASPAEIFDKALAFVSASPAPLDRDLLLRALASFAVPSLADGKAASAVKKRILALSPAPSAPEIASLFAAELGLEGFLPSFLASPGSTPFRNLLSSNRLPFLPAEKSVVLSSLSLPPSAAAALSSLLSRCAHLSHKNWSATLTFANELEEILGGGPSDSELFGRLFPRVLEGGNWAGAREYALPQGVEGGKIKGRGKPWLVLVSGLNGIRKTTSTYQPWFADVLGDALEGQWEGGEGELPTGQNSFFRQLDFMICSLAAVDFKHMYEAGGDVAQYSQRKAALFGRYRMISEMLGIVLVRDAVRRGMNVMLETSGRDVAMYEYVDFILDECNEAGVPYNKLAINFDIDDIRFAERSVDERMGKEMRKAALALPSADLRDVVGVNMGGPYGSEVLGAVKADSERVWKEVAGGERGFGDWFKASVHIKGDGGGGAWTERGGDAGAVYEFQNQTQESVGGGS
ncbi:hypothetical protein TeGR_g7581 [Tetraparma gracilis]|uniref:Uncharacterized protein n=1 Tax=Tetraparma gracilis TaxID=2962635 RepID=A0ABQ6M6C0_9STRA|nr:hypothetical protein TeGR_g7581 [Tetraparma gracilis]